MSEIEFYSQKGVNIYETRELCVLSESFEHFGPYLR